MFLLRVKARQSVFRSAQCSSVAQRQSIRLLTGGLLVRIQPEEPTYAKRSLRERLRLAYATVANFI